MLVKQRSKLVHSTYMGTKLPCKMIIYIWFSTSINLLGYFEKNEYYT